MCGGFREFESMRAPAVPHMISLLHEEMRQCSPQYHVSSYGDHVDQEPSYESLCYVRKPAFNPTTHQAEGLAIVAAICSPAATSALAPIHFSEKPCAPQSRSPAPPAPAPLLRQAVYESSLVVPRSRKCEEKVKRSKSIFFSAFSPPKDYIRVREPLPADFMGACFFCQRPLVSGNDIFIYRGDRAFCSNECRHQHIVEDELSERLQQQQANLPASNTASEPAHCKNRISGHNPIIPVLG